LPIQNLRFILNEAEVERMSKSSGKRGRRIRIAIVDDNDDFRLLIRLLLGERYFIRDFGRVNELMAALEYEKFDFILVDIWIPETDGFDFMQMASKDPRLAGVPIIATSAVPIPPDRIAAAGFTAFIEKPIQPEEFARKVESFTLERAG
jgi:CheY-like chemotaxis protein